MPVWPIASYAFMTPAAAAVTCARPFALLSRTIFIGRPVAELPGGRLVIAGLKIDASRPTLQMPAMVATVLERHRKAQAAARLKAGSAWQDHGLVLATGLGKPMEPQRVSEGIERLCGRAGIGTDWQARETRHAFVSALSDAGVDIERIADAVGHVNSNVTKGVYRHALADKVTEAAVVTDRIFPAGADR